MVSTQIGGVTMESSIRWVIGFVVAMMLAMVLVIMVPGIALWLPEALGYATD